MINFKKEVLESGITLITEKKSYFNSVSIGLWVKSGSAYEPAALNGISHFLEHLFFKGTKKRTHAQINKEIDLMGGALNAFTGTELTCLYTRVLSNNYDNAIDLLIDLLFNSQFPEDEIEKEKGVIIQEISGSQDDPVDYTMEFFHKNFYGDSSLGRPILGSQETVSSFDRATLKDYFNSHYSPRNLVISVAGNFDHDNVVMSINRHMSEVSNDFESQRGLENIKTAKNYGEFLQEKDLEQTHFFIGFEGIKKTDKDYFVLEALNTIIGGSVSSRLFRELRENKGLAYSIYSSAAFHKNDGYVYIYAGVSPKKFNISKKLIFDIVDDLILTDVKEEEISSAKKHISEGFLLGLESTNFIMNRNAINEIYNEEYISKAQILKKINSIDEDDMKRVSKLLFNDKNKRHVSVVGSNISK